MKLPTINISITPQDPPHVEVKAQWKSPDATQRTIRHIYTFDEMDDFLGNIVEDIFETIKETEDKFYG